MNIGRSIKFFRKGRRMTQKQLADLVGCAEITIRQYENGSREPKQKMLDRIAESLGTDAKTLYILASIEGDTELDENGNISYKGENENQSKEIILKYFYRLNKEGKKEAIKQVAQLTEIPRFRKEPPQVPADPAEPQ